ncbi:TPA: aminotransferase class III [Candidatus Latescibacteria bacterium]|nr:aminotransferase class III [Candidatus Latescibacterota bacterium]
MADLPTVSKSMELYRKAGERIPGWVQLISRRAERFANGVSPLYIESSKGSRFIDVDGNAFIDWTRALGAVILGYADPVVDAAVKAQIDKGSLHSMSSSLEIELADELIETIPSAEMVRYTKGGGEACAVAARIARGTTDRDIILFCGYHGWHDWYQSANYLVDPDSGEYPFAGIEPLGVPRALAGTAIPFTYGDLDMLGRLFTEHQNQIAGVMMEPARSDRPEPGYLEGVKELCKRNGSLLIFDEVSCGWRESIGGMQKLLDVTPDMTVLAKGISNGYPMGAVVGSREAMETARLMFISSSYWTDNVGLAAALTTIRELKARDSEKRLKEMGEQAARAIDDAVQSAGLTGSCTGFSTTPNLNLDLPDPDLQPKVFTLFIQEMARRGIHGYMGFGPTLAHTDEDILITAEAAEASLRVIKQGLDNENIDELLVCDTRQEPFRRLVH